MANRTLKIVILCGDGRSSRIMYNGLADHVSVASVIIEDKPFSLHVINRRLKKLGILKVGGQILFLLLNNILSKKTDARIAQLMINFNLNDSNFPDEVIRKVDSVNSETTIRLLQKIKPDAVVINGTRILSKNILSSIQAPFINTHMGITPRYRGVHGGYWALAMDDADNCGVTIHLVDEGIDTGGILYQERISPNHKDDFNTYPIHQIAKAIPLMKLALTDIGENRIKVKEDVSPSRLWYHPTLFEYLKYWKDKGVK